MEELPGSYWVEVVGTAGGIMGDDGEEDAYLVRREAGDDNAVPVARSRLRHRAIVKQCNAANSYALQCFVAKAIQHMKGDAPGGSGNAILKEGLTSLCIHGDNTAQHFKSSKSTYFFTMQLVGGERGVRLHFCCFSRYRSQLPHFRFRSPCFFLR